MNLLYNYTARYPNMCTCLDWKQINKSTNMKQFNFTLIFGDSLTSTEFLADKRTQRFVVPISLPFLPWDSEDALWWDGMRWSCVMSHCQNLLVSKLRSSLCPWCFQDFCLWIMTTRTPLEYPPLRDCQWNVKLNLIPAKWPRRTVAHETRTGGILPASAFYSGEATKARRMHTDLKLDGDVRPSIRTWPT